MPDTPFQNCIGIPFIELQSIDSTNNYALAQAHAGLAQHGTSFFAHEQIAGKGQRGKSWTAEKNSGLITSILINPHPLTITRQFQLSACTAISACELLKHYAGTDIRIKWPNDLYWHDRKAGGILIENIIGRKNVSAVRLRTPETQAPPSSEWLWAVIGIGININQTRFPSQLINPVSLKQITGKEHKPVDMAKELYLLLDKNWKSLVTNGFGDIYNRYQQLLYKKNESVSFKKGSRAFKATIKNVSPLGRLVVQHAIEEEFISGEIEWILPA